MEQKGTNEFEFNQDNGSADCSASGSNGGKYPNYKLIEPINFKTLENMLKTESETKLILALSLEANGFWLMLEQNDIRPDLMCLILAALAQASECSTEQETVHLLVQFYIKIIPKLSINANFQREIIMYSVNLRIQLAAHSPTRQTHIDAVHNLLKFLRRLQLTLYQKSFDVVQNIVDQFASQIEYINRGDNAMDNGIVELLAELKETIQNFDQMKAETEKHEVLLEPPEDFRNIPIYPTAADILYNREPFIRKNVVKGRYVGGVEHYLDTQFRLLREDFVRPLRQGISEYVQLKDKVEAMKATKYRIKDLNVYQNVNIISSEMIHNEQVHLLMFDCTPFRHIRWQVSNDHFSHLELNIFLNTF